MIWHSLWCVEALKSLRDQATGFLILRNLSAGFIVTMKPTPATKKPGPTYMYKYVKSVETNYNGERCEGIDSALHSHRCILLMSKRAGVGLLWGCKAKWEVLEWCHRNLGLASAPIASFPTLPLGLYNLEETTSAVLYVQDCNQCPHYSGCPYFRGIHKAVFHCTCTGEVFMQ